MRTIPHILLLLLATLTMVGCSEIYIPEVNSAQKALVVEGLITNGDGPFFVKLTKAQPYNSDSSVTTTYVADAQLYVTDNKGQMFPLTYQNSGKYELPTTFKAEVGRSYVLHIETSDGAIYESDAQKLMPAESVDTLYTSFSTKDYLDENKALSTVGGYDVRVDLFHTTSSANPLPLCRFESSVVVQYQYVLMEIDPETNLEKDWYWFAFGWSTFNMDETANITEERSRTSTAEIKHHYLCFVPRQTGIYGLASYPSVSASYYYRLKQYTINEDTYRYYKEANAQLSASGKIFDPVTAQLIGNMNCTSDPTKAILGFFEVSSVTQSAYLVRKSTVQVPYLTTIPTSGNYQYKCYSDFRETDDPEFAVIPFPNWWYHTN
jgi:hypothetical protein